VNPSDLRAEIPALDAAAYLNWGASGASPRRVVEAAEDCLEHQEYDAPGHDGMYGEAYEAFDGAREAVADLLGTDPADVALTESTTDGVNRVASALEWEADDVVLRTDVEHPAGVLPWVRVAEREGVDVAVAETERGRLDPASLEIPPDTRLVCLSAVTWTHGTELPVREVVERAHDAGALVLVDAVQAVGQVPVDVEAWGADFVAASGHKWLLGPWGAGFLYVRPEVAADVTPAHVGWRGVEDPPAGELRFHDGARRFEVGSDSPAPYAGLRVAAESVDEVGVGAVDRRIGELVDRLKAGLGDLLVSPPDSETGLVTFEAPGGDAEAFAADAIDDGVVVRWLPNGNVRASVHAVNDEADVDALLDRL
jgi:selenocysteine lyase/cysteine desulfurase